MPQTSLSDTAKLREEEEENRKGAAKKRLFQERHQLLSVTEGRDQVLHRSRAVFYLILTKILGRQCCRHC